MLALSLPPGPLTVLCLGAHSDDLEIGCAGTVLQIVATRPRVRLVWVVLSARGERATEARRSAFRLLARARHRTIAVEEFRDGFFPFQGIEIKEYFERLKARVRPHLVFTHHRADRHQDHRLVADLTWNTFRNHCILEYEVPKYEGGLETPNVFVPLSTALCRRKVRHLLHAFPSQRSKQWFDEETFMGLMRLRGVESASRTGYAEGFHVSKATLAL